MNTGEKEHIMKLLQFNLRLDGRKPIEFRKPLKVETNVIKTAEGSARVTIGETVVLAGIKVEVMEPFPDTPNQGSIMVGVELLPMSNPDFELGPPGIQAIELARVVDRGIRESKCLDFGKLCIIPGERVWNIVIDICPINDSGNLFDAAALAAVAALKSMTFPKQTDGKIEYKEKTNKKLELSDLPISVTVLKIGDLFVLDPCTEEEPVASGRLTACSLSDGTLCALQKGGDEPLSAEDIMAMVDLSVAKAKELRKLIP